MELLTKCLRDSTQVWEDSHSEYPVFMDKLSRKQKMAHKRKVYMALKSPGQSLEEQVDNLFQKILVLSSNHELKEKEVLLKMEKLKPEIPKEIPEWLCQSINARLKAWMESVVYFSASILSALKAKSDKLGNDYHACARIVLSLAKNLEISSFIEPVLEDSLALT